MKCENYLCIYEKDMECCLKDISLDIQGQCSECVYIDIDDKLLQEIKSKQKK